MKNLTRIMFNIDGFRAALGVFSVPDMQRFLLELETAIKMPQDYGVFIAAVQGLPPAYRNQLKEHLMNELDQRYAQVDSYIVESPEKKRLKITSQCA
jgi:hypothetical protein